VKPDIRIAWRQGFALAYQVVGTGTDDIVYLPGYESNVDRMWDIPAYHGFLERLSSLGRLITHDRRGLGCSDRVPPGAAVTLEEGRDDLVAVMDAAGCRRATVFAAQEAVFPTLLLAATRPERVERLVLFGATPSYAWSEDLPDGWTEEQWEAEIRTWEQATSLTEFLDGHVRAIAPSLEGNDAGLEALRHLLASTVSLGAAIAESRSLSRIDMRAVLPSVTAPTLVIRRADDDAASATSGRYLAERVVEGTYTEIPGRDSLPWVGDPDPILQAIERFIGPVD
jgi:pimeloyl-ACP methyl ester carboxylesterase